MKTKHSPLPWTWDKGRPKKYDLTWLTASNGKRVITLYGDGKPSPDRYLIAAAPELLYALKRLLRVSRCKNACPKDDMSCATNLAKAVIALAEGKVKS